MAIDGRAANDWPVVRVLQRVVDGHPVRAMKLPKIEGRPLLTRSGYKPRNPQRVALAIARYIARRMQEGDSRYVEYAALAYLRSDKHRLQAFIRWVKAQ